MNQPELFLYGDIGGEDGISAAQFVSALQTISAAEKPIIRIHSSGGSVNEGTAIANAIRNRQGGCVTQIDGIAASMASVIAMAGSPCRMAGNAMLAIHNVQGSAAGDAEEMRQSADIADKFNETIVATYADRTGLPKKKVRAMMDATTYLTAKEALSMGFVDEITGDLALAAVLPQVASTRPVDTPNERMSELNISAEDKSFLQTLRNMFKPADPLAQARADVAARDATIADLTGKLGEFNTVKTERDTLTAKLADAESKLKTELEGREKAIGDEVVKRLAAAGADPLKRDPKATLPNTLSRKEFQALDAGSRSLFCKNGGKLTD